MAVETKSVRLNVPISLHEQITGYQQDYKEATGIKLSIEKLILKIIPHGFDLLESEFKYVVEENLKEKKEALQSSIEEIDEQLKAII